MKRLPSIRQRPSAALIGISIAWSVAVSLVVWLAVRHEVDELMDHTLQESAQILFGLLSFNVAQLPLQGGGSLPSPVHEEQLVWQIVGEDDRVLLRSHRAPARPLAAPGGMGWSSVENEWRVYSMRFDDQGRFLHVAQRDSERIEARLEAAEITAGAALVVGLTCALWLRSRVRRELAPITVMSAAVSHFDPLQPNTGLPDALRAELVPMRDAIHELGARLAKRLANERAFSAHAAHALRTPLAGMVAQLAVAQRKSPPEAQPHLKRTREAADRLQHVVAAMLTLFRSGGDLTWQTVDLAGLVVHLPFESLAIEVQASAPIAADPDLLAAALMNLLDNALRFGASTVAVSARPAADGVCVTVGDNGRGIVEGDRVRLQSALAGRHYQELTGLGLMLADLVARAHGGHLVLLPVATGCMVEIYLGAPPAPAASA